jgi:outer membrane protein TolC
MKYRSAFRRRPFRAHRPVLDEQRTLFHSELGIAALRQQELAAVVELSRALGGGWSEARP